MYFTNKIRIYVEKLGHLMWPSFILTSIYNNLYIICEGGVLVEISNFNWSIKYIITTENVPMLPLFATIWSQKIKSGKQNNCHIVSFFFPFEKFIVVLDYIALDV